MPPALICDRCGWHRADHCTCRTDATTERRALRRLHDQHLAAVGLARINDAKRGTTRREAA